MWYFSKASKQEKLNNILFKNTHMWQNHFFKKKGKKAREE
jgi:hypothetical protein